MELFFLNTYCVDCKSLVDEENPPELWKMANLLSGFIILWNQLVQNESDNFSLVETPLNSAVPHMIILNIAKK